MTFFVVISLTLSIWGCLTVNPVLWISGCVVMGIVSLIATLGAFAYDNKRTLGRRVWILAGFFVFPISSQTLLITGLLYQITALWVIAGICFLGIIYAAFEIIG